VADVVIEARGPSALFPR